MGILRPFHVLWEVLMADFDDFLSITDSLLPILKEKLGLSEISYNLWFSGFAMTALSEDKAVFKTPTKMRQKIITQKYIATIKDTLSEILGFSVDIEIFSEEDTEKFPISSSYDKEQYDNNSVKEEEKDNFIEELINGSSNDHSSVTDLYTFDNFIEGSSNKFAKAACQAVANEPCTYNPLFIYGQPGLGKTHLLYAVTHYIKKNHSNLKFVYKKCETFMNELIEAINKGTTHAFKEKYRSADILLIDDIQFIAGKESTQVEFFHTFSALYEEDKQIILTSDRPPKDISPLEERLRTRFEQGLIADINPPDLELRIAIIKNKSENMGLEISQPLMNYMAERLRENIRQIEGVLKKLYAVVNFTGSSVTKESIDKIIAVVDPGNIPTDVIVERALKIVGSHYGVTEEELKSSKRTGNIANARHAAIYVIKKLTELSLKDIGTIFNRNHSTVISSLNTIDTNIKTKKNFDSESTSLLKKGKSKNIF